MTVEEIEHMLEIENIIWSIAEARGLDPENEQHIDRITTLYKQFIRRKKEK